jgi:hypothetical protein
MPVGGSRHYATQDLVGWNCPACGAENAGPLGQGCSSCGAGQPGRRAELPPPPPAGESPGSFSASLASRWLDAHPEASIEEAFTAGYAAGIDAARAALLQQTRRRDSREVFDPAGKVQRTLIAALELFRNRILADMPEAVESGEWCSPEEVNDLIAHISAQPPAPPMASGV